MLRAMARHRRTLEQTPGLVAGSLCFTAELDTFTGGMLSPMRWGLLCGWENDQARDEFFNGEPAGLHPFLDGSRESWHIALQTVRVVKGEWRGWHPSTDGVAGLGPEEPLAVMTYGKVRARYMPTFTWNNRKVVREVAKNPGLRFRIGLADTPAARCTFSLWRCEEDVLRFAYGAGIHDPVQRHSLAVPWGRDYFFARFRPLASRGTWDGRDPLLTSAQALSPSASA
jgi:hypothetical protein